MVAFEAMSIVLLMSLVMMSAFGIYALRYKKVPPNTAMVVFGKKQIGTNKGYRVITGGAKFIVPLLESYAFLPLNVRTLNIELKKVVIDVDNNRSKVNLKCSAQVKITSDPRFLETAAEHLLNMPDSEINEIARKTLEGHLRGICAKMRLKDIETDRDLIAGKVLTYADKDLRVMGLETRSLIIEDVVELDSAITGQISDQNLEKRIRTILEKLLKEKGINLA